MERSPSYTGFTKERESATVIIPLLSPEGDTKIRQALAGSGGNAAIIVHPFFHEQIDDSNQNYSRYTKRLPTLISKYKKLNLPLVLLEEAEEMTDLQPSLKRMGVTDGELFTIPTKPGTPEPTEKKLSEIASSLKKKGLERATVVGSYLWLGNPNERLWGFSPSPEMPIFAQNYNLDGCVGYALGKLLTAGIKATPGIATYPKFI